MFWVTTAESFPTASYQDRTLWLIGIRGIFNLLVIKAVYAPKVRYTGFRADPRVGKGHYAAAFRNLLFQGFQMFHGTTSSQ